MSGKLSSSVVPAAARTASGISSTVPGDFSDEEYRRVMVKVTAASGTSPVLQVGLTDSVDGGVTFAANWIPTVGGPGNITGVGSYAFSVSRRTTPWGPKLRIPWSITGTSASFTFSVDVFSQ